MKCEIELTEKELTTLVVNHLENLLGDLMVDSSKIEIQVKSKQNYRSEWEKAAFRAKYVYNV